MKPYRRLTELKPGESAIVSAFERRDGDTSHLRLQEMGLIPGTPVELLRFAPFGGPLEIRLRGYRLSLRRREADAVAINGA